MVHLGLKVVRITVVQLDFNNFCSAVFEGCRAKCQEGDCKVIELALKYGGQVTVQETVSQKSV